MTMSYEVGIPDTPVTLLLLQLWFPSFDIVLVRYASPDLFIRRFVSMFSMVLILFLFRAASTTIVIARRALYISSLSLGLMQ